VFRARAARHALMPGAVNTRQQCPSRYPRERQRYTRTVMSLHSVMLLFMFHNAACARRVMARIAASVRRAFRAVARGVLVNEQQTCQRKVCGRVRSEWWQA